MTTASTELSGLRRSAAPLSQEHDVVLFDIDGVLLLGHSAIPHAAAVLADLRSDGVSAGYLTNNASRSPSAVAEELLAVDIPARASEVTTSALAIAGLMGEELPAGTRVLVVGGPGLREAISDAGLEVVDSAESAPGAVVQGLALDIGWAELSEAALAVRAGAIYFAPNLDATVPRERGLMIGNGSLVAAVVNATGVSPRTAGKPAPGIFTQALQRTGGTTPVVVGDRLDTDIAGARAAGFPALHVLTGVDHARAVLLAAPEQRPSYLGTDLRALLVAHPLPEHEAGWWTCGDAAARATDGTLEVSQDGSELPLDTAQLSLDAYRCLASAAWAAADAGKAIDAAALPRLSIAAPR